MPAGSIGAEGSFPCQFDQYQRYRRVADLILALPGEEAAEFPILDVGGYPGTLRLLLPSWPITLLDKHFADDFPLMPPAVVGDAVRLPFADSTFEAVLAVDVLEHILPDNRVRALEECLRVSRRLVVAVFPAKSAEALRAEQILATFLEQKLGYHSPFLAEHLRLGLPDRTTIERAFAGHNFRIRSDGFLPLWLWMMMLLHGLDLHRDDRRTDRWLNAFYDRFLQRWDCAAPSYRLVVVASKEEALDLDRLLSAAGLEGKPVDPLAEAEKAANDLLSGLAELAGREAVETSAVGLGPFGELQGRLQEREKWIASLVEEKSAADTAIRDLQQDLAEKTSWARALDEDIARARSKLDQLHQELEDRTRWARSLDTELESQRLAAARASEELRLARERIADLERRLAELGMMAQPYVFARRHLSRLARLIGLRR